MKKIAFIISLFCSVSAFTQISVNTNFAVNGNLPIDARDTLTTLADTAGVTWTYPGLLSYAQDVDQFWYYTGAFWKELETGGSTLTEGYGINITGSVASVDTAQLTTIARTNKIDISRSLIKSDGQYVDVSVLSEYQRGVQLETLAESMGQGDWLYVPGYLYKLPASGGGIELASSRQSIFSFADRRARIVADSSHVFVFDSIGTYRTTIENLTLETARTGETGNDNSFETPSSANPDGVNQWDILHFSDGIPTGVLVVKDCHFAEADRDVIHIEGNWAELNFENCSFTGASDIHRYAIYSESNGKNSFDITASELDVYLSSTSANHTIYAQGAWSSTAIIEDYGANNNIIFEEKLKQNRPEIRGFTPLIQDFIRDPEKIVFYAPMNRLDGAVVKDYSSRKQHGVAFNGVTVETTEFGDAISLDGVNDYIEFPLQEVDVSDRKLFFSYLIKPDSTGDDGAIIGAGILSRYRYPETTDNQHALSLESRDFDFVDNEWNHIGIALTGDSMKLFVNGVEYLKKVISDTVINDIGGASLLVGPYSTVYMKAHLRDMLLYDGYYDGIGADAYYAATKGHQPIKTADNSPELDRGTVILYEPLDVVGKAELGFDRLTATITGTTSSTGLYGGTQRTFDGVNDRYIFTATDSMNAQNIYISALVQSPTLSNRRVVGKVGQYDLFVKNDGLWGRFYHTGGSYIEMQYAAFSSAKNGQYHHVGIGRVQDTVYLTYDGRIVDQDVVASASWDTNTNGLEIGSLNNANFWLGTIDEVLIVNEFSEQLVKDIFSKITNNEPMIRLPEGIAQVEVVPALSDTYAALAGATFTGDVIVPAEAYSSSWNGSNEVPTKNDVYDEMETRFEQGGNSFGASATLGTNDANSLNFETNSVTYATLSSGGGFGLTNSRFSVFGAGALDTVSAAQITISNTTALQAATLHMSNAGSFNITANSPNLIGTTNTGISAGNVLTTNASDSSRHHATNYVEIGRTLNKAVFDSDSTIIFEINAVDVLTAKPTGQIIFKDYVLTETTTSPSTGVVSAILPVDCALASKTVNPPAAPTAGDWFAVSDSRGNAGTNNITIDFTTATQNLHGASANYVMNADADFVKFTYVNSTVGWIKTN